jgi:hypothetical protein
MSSTNWSKIFESGWQKRKKKQRIEDLIQSQKGARNRSVTKQSQVSSDNPTYQGQAINSNIDNDPVTTQIILIWTIIAMI